MYIKIADKCNNIAATGKHSNEIRRGIFRAQQKPGKPKGPTSNIRPIIILSILRKKLAVCMIMKRINLRLDSAIPMPQTAYRKNRSTTEHVFATELIIERTSSTVETAYLLFLDMSKAFGSIQRNTLIQNLKKVLNQDELHMIRILLDLKIAARCRNYKSRFFITDTGTPQGDCANVSGFTFHLAKSLQTTIANHTLSLEEHNTIQK